MGLFEEVKKNVTVRQAAELYGLKPNRSGLIRCIFHKDNTPSMKVDRRYYCFGCGCTGDAVDFTAQLFGLGAREAAVKLAVNKIAARWHAKAVAQFFTFSKKGSDRIGPR